MLQNFLRKILLNMISKQMEQPLLEPQCIYSCTLLLLSPFYRHRSGASVMLAVFELLIISSCTVNTFCFSKQRLLTVNHDLHETNTTT